MIKRVAGRAFHEVCPFVSYLRLRQRIEKRLHWNSSSSAGEERDVLMTAVADYRMLSIKGLEDSLKSEHERAISLDEKTFKYAASIATALTLTSTGVAAASQFVSEFHLAAVAFMASILSAVYVVSGGLLGFGAARTLRSYGVGVRHRLALQGARQAGQANLLAECVAYQEQVNLIRVARNEVAFMSIRNGLLLLMVAIAVLQFGLLQASRSNDDVGRKIWKAEGQCKEITS